MGTTASQFEAQCGCRARYKEESRDKVFVTAGITPTRCCLPQMDPLASARTREVNESSGYECKIMFRQVKKRADGMMKDSPDANKSGWPIDLPSLQSSEQLSSYYSKLTDINNRIDDVCDQLVGSDTAKKILRTKYGEEMWKSHEEYTSTLFNDTTTIPKPDFTIMSDIKFAKLRLQGPCQVLIKQVKRDLPKSLKIRDDDVLGRIEEPTLVDAMKAGRIYICDLSTLFKPCIRYGAKEQKENLAHKPPRRDGVLCNPIAIFYKKPGEPLSPIAIQLYGDAAADKVPVNPIYTPDDNYWAWQVAKTYYNSAELHYHLVTVLYVQTIMVGACLQASCCKNLSVHHPLRQVMSPYISGCLALATAWAKLFTEGDKGYLLSFLALDMEGEIVEGDGTLGSQDTHTGGLKELAKYSYLKYDFNNCSFHHECSERMDFPNDVEGDYPFAKDGRLLWECVENFVMETVKKYYTQADDMDEDEELRQWIRDMSIRLTRIMELHPARPWEPIVFNITTIIFGCTIFYQVHTRNLYKYYADVGSFPGNPPAPPPIEKLKDDFTHADYLATLPSKRSSLLQTAALYVLSGQHHDNSVYSGPKFGHSGRFVDKSMEPIMKVYQQRLDELSDKIHQRNEEDGTGYRLMDPKWLRNSVIV